MGERGWGMGKGLAFLLLAGRAGAPVDHFGFIDFEAVMRVGGEAGGFADGATDVFGLAAGAADEVVMVVADAVFEAGGGVGGLDATEDTFIREHVQDVVDGLTGDGAELGPDRLGELIGGRVGMSGDGAQDGDTLGRDREVMVAQGGFRVSHLVGAKPRFGLCQKLTDLIFWRASPSSSVVPSIPRGVWLS